MKKKERKYRVTVYLSGPIRGIPRRNYPAFDEARDRGRALGYDIVSPVDLNRKGGVSESVSDKKLDIGKLILRDCIALANKCDAIAMLPGWESSKGALVELALAKFMNLPILDATTFKKMKTLLVVKRVKFN